jgi:short-subunit dehydrogenase
MSVVCPGFIRTGIFDAVTNVTKLKDEKTTLDFSSIKMMDANDCACVILRGVMRNKGIITVTAFARFIWWLYRLHPALTAFSVRRKVKEFRALRSER